MSQGSSQSTIPSQFLPQWHTSGHDGITNFQSGQDNVVMGENDRHSSEVEIQRHDSDPQNGKEDDNSSQEHNPVLPDPSVAAASQQQDDQNTFPLPQPVGGQPPGEQPITAPVLNHEAKIDQELQMTIGSKDQQLLSMEFNDQQNLRTGNGNQQTSMGIGNDQVMPLLNQQTAGMAMTSQHAITTGMSNSQAMTSNSQQTVTTTKLNKQVPFGMLLPIIQPQLDKERSMQLNGLYFKLKVVLYACCV